MPTIAEWMMFFTQVALVAIGGGYAFFTYQMLKGLAAQTKSASQHSLAALSNEHNWRLLTFQGNSVPTLPCALPSWENLDAEDWKWRVLHLNHLNLFKIIWSDQEDGIFSNPQVIKDWMDKGTYIFSTCTRSKDPNIKGRKQLQQLLRKEEGFPDEFYDWLVKNCIIPREFVVERHPK